MIELLGTIATVIAITGVVLNNHLCIYCFPLWILSNGLTAWIHWRTGIVSLLGRDLIFLALAVMGWWQWARKRRTNGDSGN